MRAATTVASRRPLHPRGQLYFLVRRMPYATNDSLPESVRGHLPRLAQDIYREAFNHAWVEYGGQEARAHRVAWAAVKHRYVKSGGVWIAKGT